MDHRHALTNLPARARPGLLLLLRETAVRQQVLQKGFDRQRPLSAGLRYTVKRGCQNHVAESRVAVDSVRSHISSFVAYSLSGSALRRL